jgi:hypothetical protein
MSNNENDDEEAAADREKARCRRNRRTSVQFIDKNVIRRRSSGNEKASQSQSRLLSINSNCETDSSDFDHLQQYSENFVFFPKKNKSLKRINDSI